MITMIAALLIMIVLATLATLNYQSYTDVLEKYEYAEDRLELEQTKNKVLQEENATLADHVWHLNQNLEKREDGE